MRKIAIINQKGGSGKTTTVVNVGSAIAEAGHRTLLIDLDPQAHTTIHLGFEPFSLEKSVYDVLINEIPVDDVLIQTRIKNLSLMPAKIELASAEIEMVNTIGREIVLREALKKSKNNFDYILIDCPPSLGLLTLNALTTASEVIIPIQAEFFALEGLTKLIQTIQIVSERINPSTHIAGVLITMFDRRKNICKEVAQKVKNHFEERVFKTKIRENVKLAEAPSFGQTIFEFAVNSHGAEDYKKLAKEILNGGKYEKERTGKRPVKLDNVNNPGEKTGKKKR
ncbi:MAG TPA: AAA family ATPase [Candidatus Ratteibacteria bacterium]|uniref:Sporulation initiation inhibitor protein Soj n=1 Tax=candidate division TA06 bacterium ADurb.Bin131 TaxID=1852827 RepID=A0A1V6C462_UNCT6|nr:MAG: Sporulation initiation inhibitor protein Soj [candidate division TA06 bacterium ADurb.Bin131]HOC03291.1 AAA family ATPase [bacterium]HRS05836.1 AAA family ATPase [Candidatus Ratteibacteria bacterium]HON05006.1 AAA family ATPase [bacterium]HOQ82428.1 AAA family ATPase [bacterium]